MSAPTRSKRNDSEINNEPAKTHTLTNINYFVRKQKRLYYKETSNLAKSINYFAVLIMCCFLPRNSRKVIAVRFTVRIASKKNGLKNVVTKTIETIRVVGR